jgi:hypothetical protein
MFDGLTVSAVFKKKGEGSHPKPASSPSRGYILEGGIRTSLASLAERIVRQKAMSILLSYPLDHEPRNSFHNRLAELPVSNDHPSCLEILN